MQRDVEIEIETMDKGGTFLGTITLANTPKQTNLALALLRGGLAKLQPFFSAERVRGGSELVAAEAAARDARLKVGVQLCRCVGTKMHALWLAACCAVLTAQVCCMSIQGASRGVAARCYLHVKSVPQAPSGSRI